MPHLFVPHEFQHKSNMSRLGFTLLPAMIIIPEYSPRALSCLEIQDPLQQSVCREDANPVFPQRNRFQKVREKGLGKRGTFRSV